jgi:hypothetical protein
MAKVQVDLNEQEEEIVSTLKKVYPKSSKEKIIKMIVSKVKLEEVDDGN